MNRRLTQHIDLKAFTLIELLAVMVIILVLAGLFVGVSGPASQSAKKRKAEVMVSALEVAIGMYKADTGVYPAYTGSTWIIDSLKDDPGVTGWGGPYMEFKRDDYQDNDPSSNVIVDPWKEKAYHYDPKTDIYTPAWGNTNSFNLWSEGPNKTDDSTVGYSTDDYGDDIYNW